MYRVLMSIRGWRSLALGAVIGVLAICLFSLIPPQAMETRALRGLIFGAMLLIMLASVLITHGIYYFVTIKRHNVWYGRWRQRFFYAYCYITVANLLYGIAQVPLVISLIGQPVTSASIASIEYGQMSIRSYYTKEPAQRIIYKYNVDNNYYSWAEYQPLKGGAMPSVNVVYNTQNPARMINLGPYTSLNNYLTEIVKLYFGSACVMWLVSYFILKLSSFRKRP